MIIITGASRGIGKYLMQKFLDKGEKICGTYQTTVPDKHLMPFMEKVDVSDYKSVGAWINGFESVPEKITLLNCAGTNYNAVAHKADPETWARVIEVNLIGTFNIIHAVLPIMRDQKYGRIINFSSIVGQMGVPGTSAYSASKTGMYGLAKSIAAENASRGITINNLRLGYFDIGMISEVPEKFQQAIKEKIPTGQFGNPQNIWNAVQFLRESDYVNGANIDMNAAII
jgi:NAD(P)-dependent dehydrogenase (short-subunit alcohol dehydrogenase family)